MASTMKPQHFVTRENGSHVPLVALDELPSHLNLRNVPRMLSPLDIQQMTHLGVQSARHRKYVVEQEQRPFPPEDIDKTLMGSMWAAPKDVFPNSGTPMTGYSTPQDNLPKFGTPTIRQQSSQHVLPDIGMSSTNQEFPEDIRTKLGPANSNYAARDSPNSRSMSPGAMRLESPVNSHARPSGDVRTVPVAPTADPELLGLHRIQTGHVPLVNRADKENMVPGRKEYCSYWLRHGECDYAQQGCLYRHEMPLQKDVLFQLGLKDIPRWYREEYGVKSLLAADNSIGIEDTSRKGTWRGRGGAGKLPLRLQQLHLDSHVSNSTSLSPYASRTPPMWRGKGQPNTRAIGYASPFPPSPRGPPNPPSSHRQGPKRQPWDDRLPKEKDLICFNDNEDDDTESVTSASVYQSLPPSPVQSNASLAVKTTAAKHKLSPPSSRGSGRKYSRATKRRNQAPTPVAAGPSRQSVGPTPPASPPARGSKTASPRVGTAAPVANGTVTVTTVAKTSKARGGEK